MIICNSKKFIYIHIPKCGGTTVSSFFEQRLLPQDLSLNLSPYEGWDRYLEVMRKRFGLHKHASAAKIATVMTPKHFKEYFTFTFCRNPFSRAYSVFTFTKRADARHRPNSQRYKDIKDMSFEQFLDSVYMREKKGIAGRLQSDWIRDSPSPVKWFKLERVDQSLPRLAKRFYDEDIVEQSLPRKNFSSGKDDWLGMSSDAEKKILELYSEDFDRFEYPRRLPRD